jgi:putative thioredoxin
MPEQSIAATSEAVPAGLIVETSSSSFRADVIAQSTRLPVLVDFWAPWCEPCKKMTPVLEKVVKAAGGKVRLAKMNIEQYPEIAGQLGIQSIPAVIAFQKGQPLNGFSGALPESQIRAFLERLVGPIGGEFEALLADAEAALVAGEISTAADLFHEARDAEPDDVKAIAGLAKSLVALGELDQAEEVLAPAAGAKDIGGALAAARAALDVARQAENVGDFGNLQKAIAADPTNFQARFDLAIALNATGRRKEAAESLMEIIKRDRAWNDEAARKQLLQLFEAWGHMDPDTMSARRKLSVLLFS